MYVLLISRGFPSKRNPQWGCFEKDQAIALQASGHKVVMMSIDVRFRLYWRKIGISHIKDKRIDIYNFFVFPSVIITYISQRLAFFIHKKLILLLYKKIEKEQGKPDIIYAHYLSSIALSVPIKKNFNIPLVGIEHWSMLNQKQLPHYVYNRGYLAYSMVDRLISVSYSLRNQILLHFNKDSIVIHNMVGEEFVSQKLKSARGNNSLIKYVSVGSLLWVKGFNVLIEAFSKSGLKEKKVTLTIIGDGKERNTLQQQIIDADLTDSIFLAGTKSKLEIIDILNNSDVFVFPSRSENFSVAVIEALSLGLPVVATLCGGIRECVDESNGILVPVEDVDALTNAMQKMYQTFTHYDRKAIAENCQNKFSPSVIAKELTEVFEEVVENSKKEK